METKKKGASLFYIFYFVVFFGGAIHGSFLNLYLNNAGMDSETIGLVNGIIQIISLAAFPMWGAMADRASSKNKVLMIQLIGSILLLIAFSQAKSLLALGIVMVVFSLVHDPMASIYETITLEHANKNGWNYSPIRMSGTIGYAVMAVVAGFWLSSKESLIFPLYIGGMAVSAVFAFMLPKTKPVKKPVSEKKEKTESVYVLLKNRRVRNVLVLFMIYTLSNTFNRTYYGIYMTQLGGNYTMVGIANMIMALAEIPFHVGPGRKWVKKMGIEKMLLVVMAVGTVRWTVAATCQNAWILVMTMAFNGIMLVPVIVGLVEFLYDSAPDHLKASAQTALKSPFQVGGQLIATLLGGKLVGIFNAAGLPGIRLVYMCLAPLCLIAGLMVGIPMLKRERAEKASLTDGEN